MKRFIYFQVEIDGVPSIPSSIYVKGKCFSSYDDAISYVEQSYSDYVSHYPCSSFTFLDDVIYKNNLRFMNVPEVLYTHQFIYRYNSTGLFHIVSLHVRSKVVLYV